MKGTDHFKRTVQMYLEQRAEEEALFAKNYRLHVFSYSEIRRIDINWLILPYRIEVYGYLEQEEAFRRYGENQGQGHEAGMDCAPLPLLPWLPLP
ncbi:putative t/G mismatch-specific endonuclease [Bacteroides fragilis str. 3725 D9(v)]|nr:putative t/G mismatch-specific endonuclease [Bacteroides fragilis str. 1007-1-F \